MRNLSLSTKALFNLRSILGGNARKILSGAKWTTSVIPPRSQLRLFTIWSIWRDNTQRTRDLFKLCSALLMKETHFLDLTQTSPITNQKKASANLRSSSRREKGTYRFSEQHLTSQRGQAIIPKIFGNNKQRRIYTLESARIFEEWSLLYDSPTSLRNLQMITRLQWLIQANGRYQSWEDPHLSDINKERLEFHQSKRMPAAAEVASLKLLSLASTWDLTQLLARSEMRLSQRETSAITVAIELNLELRIT